MSQGNLRPWKVIQWQKRKKNLIFGGTQITFKSVKNCWILYKYKKYEGKFHTICV